MAVVDTLNSLGKIILPKENPVELTITNNTITIDPNSGSYFFLNDIDSNLTINISSLSASSKTIYLKLNFDEDNIVISWPNNIKWQEIASPSISQYEDVFISLMTLDGGTTWYSEPIIKTKPFMNCANYMKNTHPTTCSTLASLPISDSNYFGSVRSISFEGTFNECSGLTSLDLSTLDTSNVINMYNMFKGCTSLTSLDVSNFDTSKVTNMSSMFNNCTSLTSLDVSNFDTSKVTNMSSMFSYCSSLTSLDLSNWDTSSVTTSMSNMFNGCSSLTSLDLSNWDTSSVTSTFGMFYEDSKLQYIILNSSTVKFTISGDDLRSGCKILVPSSALDTYKAHSAWSSRASQFDAIENYTITRSNGQITVTPNNS